MIIAIVPAPGHEALVAPAPQVLPDMAFMEPERPAVLVRCEHCGRWDCVEYGHWIDDRSDLPRALVLYAPGDPKLGMLRLESALGIIRRGKVRESRGALRAKYKTQLLPGTFVDWDWRAPRPSSLPVEAFDAFFLVSVAEERGIAAEVIVLPADKAKE